jgi:hypothetical protein
MYGKGTRRWPLTGALLALGLFSFGNGPQPDKHFSSLPAVVAATTAAPATTRDDDEPVRLRIPSHPLRNEADLDVLLREIGDARVVLLGEASHGTAEYYTWRAALSRRLIQEKGFDFIAVEGEWADSYRVNQFIRGEKKDSAAAVALLRQYNRWPTWMWGNYEVASLVTWLNARNQGRPAASQAGFYGLDVYCLWESMTELMPLLPRTDTGLRNAAQKVHRCFQPYSADAQRYAEAVANAEANCQGETNRLWNAVRKLADGRPPTTKPASCWNRTPWWPSTPSGTTARWWILPNPRGTSATGTWPRRYSACSTSTAHSRRPSCGSTTRTWATPATPTWPAAAR